MKARVFAAAAAVVLGAPAGVLGQQPFRTLSIADAVTEALNHNVALQAQRSTLTIADAAIVTAGLRPNPVLSGDADHLDLLGTGFDDVNNAGPPEYGVRVDVPVERGGKRDLRLDLARYGKELAAAQLADAVRRLKVDVLIGSIDVLEAKAKLSLAQENLDTLQRLVDLNQRRLTSGAIAPLEATRSRVAMLQYRSNVRSAELTLAQARLRLLPLLGAKPGDAPIDIDDDLAANTVVGAPTLSDLQATARAKRPDVLAARADQARSQADVRLQIGQGKIDYSVGTEYRRQQGVAGRGNMLGFFVSAPLPIFNRNQGEIARAQADEERTRQSAAAVDIDVNTEVASAFEEFQTSRRLLQEIEQDLLEPARSARAGTAYTYQAGATSLLDVLDAQRAFNDTMDSYYSAQAAYRRAEAKLMLVTGDEVMR
ncbi:MAG TPA: TolC family protein [Vicinamibacterales bacterium]|jgi:cobalt-zinc-cadmium efflux system outer membrane protein